jgi:hypothetical protein
MGLGLATSNANADALCGNGDTGQVFVSPGKNVKFTLRQNLSQVAYITISSSRTDDSGHYWKQDTTDYPNVATSANREHPVPINNPSLFAASGNGYCVKVTAWYGDKGAGLHIPFGRSNQPVSVSTTGSFAELDWCLVLNKNVCDQTNGDVDAIVRVIEY